MHLLLPSFILSFLRRLVLRLTSRMIARPLLSKSRGLKNPAHYQKMCMPIQVIRIAQIKGSLVHHPSFDDKFALVWICCYYLFINMLFYYYKKNKQSEMSKNCFYYCPTSTHNSTTFLQHTKMNHTYTNSWPVGCHAMQLVSCSSTFYTPCPKDPRPKWDLPLLTSPGWHDDGSSK